MRGRVGTPNELITWLLSLKDNGLSDQLFEVKEHKKKRTLSQNAYYWQLLTKTAKVLKMTNTELHNQMLAEYGYVDQDIKTVIMNDEINWRTVPQLHLRPTTKTKVLDNGKLYRVYIVMRGSHTYNTKEMSRLVDGMVQEAREQGIETLTPHELAEMRRLEQEAEDRKRRRGA